MPLIQKPNYNQIFASQAPDIDKPAVFNNYPEGWGPESRPNNGKPTIKGFNYLQQTNDLKDLWILQNGACLPYDDSIEYADGAPVLKDGVIQYKVGNGFKSRDAVTIPTYSNSADGVDPVTGVADGAYFNVRSSSDESYIDEYQNVGGSAVTTGRSYSSARVVAVDSIADLQELPEGQRKEGLRYLVKGYHAGSDVGGGEFYWDSTRTAENDGGLVLDGFVRVIEGSLCNVMWFGAVPGGVIDATSAVAAAALAAREIGTLYAPNDDLLLEGTVNVYTSCDFHGRFVVPSGNAINTFQAVTPVELEINGADALLSMSRDDTQLRLKGDFDLPDLSDYYLSIRSTEVLQVRLGDPVRFTPYTKNQTVDIVDNAGGLKNPVLYTIDNLSAVTLHFIRKESPITVRGLNIVLTGEGELQNQRLFLVRRYGVEFNGLRVYGRDGGAVGTGIELRDSCNIVIRNSSLNQIGTDTVDFDSYQIVNYRSSFVYIYNHDWQRGDTPIRRSYNARHGDFVYFQDSTLAGIDDHYGSNYFIDRCTLHQHVNFAGRNISIKNCQFINAEHLIRIRPDTPYADGEAIIEDCTMYMAHGATRIPDIIYYNIGGQSDTQPYNRDMRVFDKIKIKNVNCVVNTDTPMLWPSSVTPAAILIFANFTNPAIEANNKLFIGDVEMEGVDWGTHLLRVTAGNVETHLGSLSFRNTKLQFLYEGASDPASVRLTGNIVSAGNIRFEWCENPHIFAHQVPLEGAEINIVGGVFRAEAHCDYFMRLNAFEGRITYRDANFIRRGGGEFNMPLAQTKYIDNHFDSEWTLSQPNYGARVYVRGNSGMSGSLPTETSRGVATVAVGSTSTTVNHNLGRAPLLRDISLVPTSRSAAESSYWVSDVNSTTFTLNLAEAASPTFATFHWKLNN